MAQTTSVLTRNPQDPDSGKITYEDFLTYDWPNPHVEWVNGEVLVMPPVTDDHSNEESWLGSLFRIYAESRGGWVLRDPFQMKSGPVLHGRTPDLFYIAPENLTV